MGRDIAHACRLVEVLQISLYTSDVADDTLLGQVRDHLLEHRDGVLQRNGIDQQFGLKRLYFFEGRKALAVVGKPHALGVALKDCHLVIEAQQVDEEASHLACS